MFVKSQNNQSNRHRLIATKPYTLLKTLTAKRMERKIPGFLKLIKQLHQSPLHALAKTLESWLEPIVAMWRFSKSNGITEGFHNKMEMLSRRAYGFRKEH